MAVTAWPVIKVDSTAGGASDTACSGAGPATALTGTLGATDGAGTTITLDALTDLTNVATDGSHVIYFADTTAGHRRFAAINGKAGSGGATPTVTVEQALSISLSGKSWAIGGTRATVWGSVSALLFNNNAAAGDAMPGWQVRPQSGHTESISVEGGMRRAGDTTSGPIILQGEPGAATKPKITATSAINMIGMRGNYQIFRNIELTAGAASMTAALINVGSNESSWVDQVTLSRTSTNTFVTGISSSGGMKITNCEIQRCATGITFGEADTVLGNYIHDCTGNGITVPGTAVLGGTIAFNVIAACGGDGINSAFTGTISRSLTIIGNTIDSCTSDGIEFTGAVSDGYANLRIIDNILSNNGQYGLNFSNSSATNVYLSAVNPSIRGNNTYLNTSGAYHSASGAFAYNAAPWALGDNGLNPTYTGGGNYTPTNASLAGTAYPTSIP